MAAPIFGIVLMVLGSLALLMSLYSFYQLKKGGTLTPEFWKRKGPKTAVLTLFWLLFLYGGFELQTDVAAGTSTLETAFLILIFYLGAMLLSSIILFLRINMKTEELEKELPIDFKKVMRKSLFSSAILFIVVLIIAYLLQFYLTSLL